MQGRDGRNADQPTWCRGLVACLMAAVGVVLLAIGAVIAGVASYYLIDKLLNLWCTGLPSAASLRDVNWMAWIVGLVWTGAGAFLVIAATGDLRALLRKLAGRD